MDPDVAAKALASREAQIHAQLALIEAASKRTTVGGIGFGKRVGVVQYPAGCCSA